MTLSVKEYVCSSSNGFVRLFMLYKYDVAVE